MYILNKKEKQNIEQIRMHWNARVSKDGRVRDEWVLKKENMHENSLTICYRLIFTSQYDIRGGFNLAPDKNLDWKSKNLNKEP